MKKLIKLGVLGILFAALLVTPVFAKKGASKETMDVYAANVLGQTLDNTKSFAIARCNAKGTLKVNGHLHKSNQAGKPLNVYLKVDGGPWTLVGSFTPNKVGNGNFKGTISGLFSGPHDVVVAIDIGVTCLYINSASAPAPPFIGIPFVCP